MSENDTPREIPLQEGLEQKLPGKLAYDKWLERFFVSYFSIWPPTAKEDIKKSSAYLEKGFMLRNMFITGGLYFMDPPLEHTNPEHAAKNLQQYLMAEEISGDIAFTDWIKEHPSWLAEHPEYKE